MRANQAMTETIHLSTQTRPIDKVRLIQARCGVFNLDTSAQSPMVSDSTQYYVYMCVCWAEGRLKEEGPQRGKTERRAEGADDEIPAASIFG